MTKEIGIGDFAFTQMSHLLARLALQVHRAAKKPGADEVHDLRVSIRRFSQGLDLFADFFPRAEAAGIRKKLKALMRLTSSIRDRDITLEFVAGTKHASHRPRLSKERASYQKELAALLRQWTAEEFSTHWRDGLSLRA